jgi:hypothetical protein
MKYITVMPNFTIVAEKNESFSQNYFVLESFCEKISSVEHTTTYKITPESFWRGLNQSQSSENKFSFSEFIKKFSTDEVPGNVLTDISSFENKFGKVVLIGDDSLLVKDNLLLEEIKNSSSFDSFISEIYGNVILFKNITLNKLEEMFIREFNHPIRYHIPNLNTYVFWDGFQRYAVKANSEPDALEQFYNKHPFICEEDLREKLDIPKREVEESDIKKYILELIENPYDAKCKIDLREVPKFAIAKPIAF